MTMTIDEAKICLSIQLEVKRRLGKNYEANALQLGIEALKFRQNWKEGLPFRAKRLLPGETEAI